MIIGYLAFISRGVRWLYLLEPLGHKPNKWNSIHSISIGYFTNMIVPRAGELARCATLYRTDKIPVNRLFGTAIMERVIDLIMLICSVLLVLFLEFNNLNSFFNDAFNNNKTEKNGSAGLVWKLVIAAIIVGVVSIAYMLRHRFLHHLTYIKVKDFWHGVKKGFRSLSKVKQKGWFTAHTLFIWAMYYLIIYINVFSLKATSHLTASNGLFIMVVAGLGMLMPTPGGIGSFHYLVMLGMGIVGVAPDDAVSFATLVHISQLIMTVIAGSIALVIVSAYRKAIKQMKL